MSSLRNLRHDVRQLSCDDILWIFRRRRVVREFIQRFPSRELHYQRFHALRTPSRQRIVRRLERRLSHRLDRLRRPTPPNPVEAINACAATTRSGSRLVASSHVVSTASPSSRCLYPPLTPHHTLKTAGTGRGARVIHPSKHQDVRFPRISPASRPRVHSTHIAERSNRRRGRGRGARDRGHGRVGATRRARARPSSSITVTAMGVIVNARRRRRARERREGDEERAHARPTTTMPRRRRRETDDEVVRTNMDDECG